MKDLKSLITFGALLFVVISSQRAEPALQLLKKNDSLNRELELVDHLFARTNQFGIGKLDEALFKAIASQRTAVVVSFVWITFSFTSPPAMTEWPLESC